MLNYRDNRIKMLFVSAFLSVIVLTVYSDVIRDAGFLFDDFEYVIGNHLIADLSNVNMSDPRQIGYLSFALNYALGGEDPFGYHLVNVLIHIGNGLLVFLLMRSLAAALDREKKETPEQFSAALLAAALFLVHPLQTQAVSYVTQRFTSLAAFFYLLAAFLYLSSRLRLEEERPWRVLLAAAVVSTVFGMRTKEISFTVPFVLLMFELTAFQSSRLGKRRFYCLLPFAVTLIIIPVSILGPDWGIIERSQGIADVTRMEKIYDFTERSPLIYLFTQFRVIVTYIAKLLLPVNQVVMYDFRVSRTFWEFEVIGALLLLLSLAGSAFYLLRKSGSPGCDRERAVGYRLVSIGILWFFIAISVESSVIPIKDVIFEHRVYLPSAGFFIAGAVLVMQLSGRLLNRWSRVVRIAVPLLVLAVPLSIATYIRNDVWTDELKLWDDVVQKSPNKPIGYNNRATAYLKMGEYERALNDVDRTISFFPKNQEEMMIWENADMTPSNMAKTFSVRGDIHMALGDVVRAKADYQRGRDVFVMPVDIDEKIRIADLYSKQGAFNQAVEEYNKVLQWDPMNVAALHDRANAYTNLKRFQEAITDLSKIITNDPNFVLAYFNRGIAYGWSGNKAKAIEDLTQACSMGFELACQNIENIKQGRLK